MSHGPWYKFRSKNGNDIILYDTFVILYNFSKNKYNLDVNIFKIKGNLVFRVIALMNIQEKMGVCNWLIVFVWESLNKIYTHFGLQY